MCIAVCPCKGVQDTAKHEKIIGVKRMKKSLLFVLPSLKSGGAEKSLVTLLRLTDFKKYDVDLLLFRKEGLFLDLLPSEVNVIEADTDYRMFDGGAVEGMKYFLKNKKPSLAIARFLYGRAQGMTEEKRIEKSWKYLSLVMPRLPKKYDAAIGYLEGTSTYYIADFVNAEKYVSVLHTDYDRISAQRETDSKYYKKTDLLIGVSEKCTQKAVRYFPFLDGKTATVYNIISPTLISEMAKEDCEFPERGESRVILTVGRMSEPKGIDTAVSACFELVKRGHDIRWYHIGTGEDEEKIKRQIKELSLTDRFILLGEQSNPYKFMSRCDIYVQPSRFEGKSIAVDEAKALGKPIAVTDFDTVFDQIEDGVNGIISKKDPESVATAVERLLFDTALCDRLGENLRSEKVGNEEEAERFFGLLWE